MNDKTFTLDYKGRDLDISYRWSPPQPTKETEHGIELCAPAAFIITKIKDGIYDIYSDFTFDELDYFEERAYHHMTRRDELFT